MDATEKCNCIASAGKSRSVDKKNGIFIHYYHFNRSNAHIGKISSNLLWLGEEMLLNIEVAVIA